MEFKVVALSENKVLLDSPLGSFWANWRSPLKIAYRSYTLELDCEDVLNQSSIRHSLSSTPSISSNKDCIVINGVVEHIEDRVLFLRIGSTLLMLEIANTCDFAIYLDQYVEVSLSHINVYTIDL